MSHSDYIIVDIPELPPRMRRSQKPNILRELQVGQGIVVETRAAAVGIAQRGRRLGYNMSMRQTEDGYVVRRNG